MVEVTVDIEVVGIKHHLSAFERDRLNGTLQRKPIKVKLDREPDNKWDTNAITVTLPKTLSGSLKGKQMGHLPRESAAVLAPKLDAGTAIVVNATLLVLHRGSGMTSGDLRVVVAKNLGK